MDETSAKKAMYEIMLLLIIEKYEAIPDCIFFL